MRLEILPSLSDEMQIQKKKEQKRMKKKKENLKKKKKNELF